MLFILASGNRHKLQEYRAILAPYEVVLMPGGIELPPEGITSFRENAVAKARALASALAASPAQLEAVAGVANCRPSGSRAMLALADDSGLEVESLDWRPGVVSSRFAGDDADDVANYEKLLSLLGDRHAGARRARFVCVAAAVALSVVTPRSAEYVAAGEWWGSIATTPGGEGGFGYDPVFLPEGSDLTVAQLPQELKDQVSHRALAGRALVELLEQEGLSSASEDI
jgi:XTP/dITP diphosphohydrolase